MCVPKIENEIGLVLNSHKPICNIFIRLVLHQQLKFVCFIYQICRGLIDINFTLLLVCLLRVLWGWGVLGPHSAEPQQAGWGSTTV